MVLCRAQLTRFVIMITFALLAYPRFLIGQDRAQPMRVSLNGEWDFTIHGQGHRKVQVPSTYLPVGGASVERSFDIQKSGPDCRVLLHFDGIVMTGKVSVNGQEIGKYGPYTPFTIDITDPVVSGTNR